MKWLQTNDNKTRSMTDTKHLLRNIIMMEPWPIYVFDTGWMEVYLDTHVKFDNTY